MWKYSQFWKDDLKKQTSHFIVIDTITQLYDKAPEKIFTNLFFHTFFLSVSNYSSELIIVTLPHLEIFQNLNTLTFTL